jgi:hypothetical protein
MPREHKMDRLSRRHAQLTGAAVLLGLSITACSGPAAPLDIGTQTVPIALVLGELKAVQEAPVGPVSAPAVPQSMPYFRPQAPGAPSLPSLPPTPVGPCPDFDPLAPVLGVGRVIAAPPVKATYPYRAQVVDVYPGKTSAYVGNSTWTIEPGPVDPTTGAYDVTYTVKLGAATTKRVLRTLPHDIGSDPSTDPTDQTNPNAAINTVNGYLTTFGAPPIPAKAPNPAGYGLAGVYLVSQESNGVAFTPSTPIALLQLRQLTGATDPDSAAASSITSAGSDPATGAAMSFRSTVTTSTNKVNACGTPLQTVQVALTSPNSPLVAPPPNPATALLPTDAAFYFEKAPATDPTKPKSHVLLFAEKIDFGLQYGGLIVKDESSVGAFGGYEVSTDDPPAPPKDPSPDGVLGSFVGWYGKHMVIKQSSFTINEKPKYPKPSSST